MTNTPEHVRQLGEGLSVMVIIATILQWLPQIAAVFSIIWYSILIYDRLTKKGRKHDNNCLQPRDDGC